LIFSLLNVRKKTAATLAGIAVGGLCLWGVAMWQDISVQELFNLLISILVMLTAVIGAALLLIIVIKLSFRLLGRLITSNSGDEQRNNDQSDSGQR
jgi:hypothetical protein